MHVTHTSVDLHACTHNRSQLTYFQTQHMDMQQYHEREKRHDDDAIKDKCGTWGT